MIEFVSSDERQHRKTRHYGDIIEKTIGCTRTGKNNIFSDYLLQSLKIHTETFFNKASQAIQSPRTVPFFLLVSLLDGYSFPNVLVKGIVAFKH